ncbi:MAG TPA: c-type cytochrome biogenesis protein CcmI [Candidatus Sulfotelmatobacter sp.]|jgi:cytochrome c-type biogenesis protein CcmH|nr:c-type cytochrome biogenesis protein CcmI [Candidatus Sulfotelmatobacter sp.]
MIWLVLAALTVAVLALILVPLLRRQTGAAQRLGYDVAVYRDQLAEVERDVERGVLTFQQAEGVKAEVQRRMLSAAEADRDEQAASARSMETGRRLRLAAALLILVLVPGGTLYLYGVLGAPELPAQPFAERQNSPLFKMTAMVEKLMLQLQQSPDPKGYAILGGSLRQLGRMDEAVSAYRKSIELGAGGPEIYSSLGEAVVLANRGGVGPDARQAFLQALAQDAKDPRARFYLGLSKAQIGKADEAIAIWRDLQNDTPADAPWRGMLEQQISRVAADAKIDPASIAPKAPTIEGTAAVAADAKPSLGPDGQNDMIQRMVAGLAAKMEKSPGDADGWIKLSRSYRVLNQFDKAKEAAQKAVALRPKDADPLLTLADAQLAAASGDKLPADFLATMGKVMELSPDNGDALYYVGAGELQAGHPAKARELWGKLLPQLPPDSQEHADLQKQIDELPKP